MNTPLAVAAALLRAAPPIQKRHYHASCCVGAVRAALAVFRRYGHGRAVAPTVCMMTVYNPPYRARVESGNPARNDDELIALEPVDGSWAVGVGYPGGPAGGVDGHLVVTGRQGGRMFLLDTTATQADRPARGIVLRPVLVEVRPEFVGPRAPECWYEVNGCSVGYRARPGVTDYTRSPNWTDARGNTVYAEILAAVADELGPPPAAAGALGPPPSQRRARRA